MGTMEIFGLSEIKEEMLLPRDKCICNNLLGFASRIVLLLFILKVGYYVTKQKTLMPLEFPQPLS